RVRLIRKGATSEFVWIGSAKLDDLSTMCQGRAETIRNASNTAASTPSIGFMYSYHGRLRTTEVHALVTDSPERTASLVSFKRCRVTMQLTYSKCHFR